MKKCLTLTEREKEVKDLIFQGLTNKAIAEELIVSTHTAQAHVSNILHKMNLKNRYEMFIYEIEQLKSKIANTDNTALA